MSDLTDIGKLAGGGVLRDFLSVAHNDDGSPSDLTAACGFIAATAPPSAWNAVAAASSQFLRASAVSLPEGLVITNLTTFVSTTGASTTLARLAIYDSDFNLVASTPNTTSIASSIGYQTVALSEPYNVPVAGLYYFAELYVGTGLPTVVHQSSLGSAIAAQSILPNGSYLAFVQTGQSDLPSKATPAGTPTQVALGAS